jgi:hypothetical protein
VSDDQQQEFRSLSEFYIIIFLNKLKIVENTKKKTHEKIKIKCIMLRIWGPSEIHRPLLGSPGPALMY